MSIINDKKEIPGMYEIRHKHDTINHEDFGFDYTNNLYNRSVSGFLLKNPKVKEFLDGLSKIMATMVDSGQLVKNYFFFTHDKFYNKNGK